MGWREHRKAWAKATENPPTCQLPLGLFLTGTGPGQQNRVRCSSKNVSVNVHSSTIPQQPRCGNSPIVHQRKNVETKCGLSVHGILFSHKKEWGTDIYYNMDELRKNYAKWKKPDTKDHTLCYMYVYEKCMNWYILTWIHLSKFHLYERFRTGKSTETESRLIVGRDWGSDCLMSRSLLSGSCIYWLLPIGCTLHLLAPGGRINLWSMLTTVIILYCIFGIS